MKNSHEKGIDTYPTHMIQKGTSWTIPFPTDKYLAGFLGGSNRVRIRRQAMRSRTLMNAALIRTPLAKPTLRLNKLFNMMGWTTDPSEDPVEMRLIASVRRWRKY